MQQGLQWSGAAAICEFLRMQDGRPAGVAASPTYNADAVQHVLGKLAVDDGGLRVVMYPVGGGTYIATNPSATP